MIFDNKIRCFLAVADSLNFTKTAKNMFMSQQAASKTIASLEKELGFALFERSTRSVKLTEAGDSCYTFFSKLERENDAFLAEIRHRFSDRNNTLNVGFQNFLDFGFIPGNAMKELNKQYPDAVQNGYRYSPYMLSERLQNRQLDIILINGRFAPKSEGLKKLELAKIEQVLMIAADSPLVSEKSTYKDFLKETFLIDSFENESNQEFEARVRKEIEIWGLEPKEVIRVPDRDSAYTSAELGQGIVIGTEKSRVARNRNLKKFPTGKMETLLVMWRENETNPVVAKYARCLLEEYNLENKK